MQYPGYKAVTFGASLCTDWFFYWIIRCFGKGLRPFHTISILYNGFFFFAVSDHHIFILLTIAVKSNAFWNLYHFYVLFYGISSAQRNNDNSKNKYYTNINPQISVRTSFTHSAISFSDTVILEPNTSTCWFKSSECVFRQHSSLLLNPA